MEERAVQLSAYEAWIQQKVQQVRNRVLLDDSSLTLLTAICDDLDQTYPREKQLVDALGNLEDWNSGLESSLVLSSAEREFGRLEEDETVARYLPASEEYLAPIRTRLKDLSVWISHETH